MSFIPHLAEYLADIIDLLVVLMLGVWVIAIIIMSTRDFFKGKDPTQITYDVRVGLGPLILLALEFLIVSDVLHSIASRTLEDLAIVGAVVVVRVVMAYFLDKELGRLEEKQEKKSKGTQA